MKVYAAVLTHNRQEMCAALVEQLRLDGVESFVLDNNSEPPFVSGTATFVGREVHEPEDFCISRSWNRLLNWVEAEHESQFGLFDEMEDWCAIVFNDDVTISPGFCQRLADLMEEKDVDIVSGGSMNYWDKTKPHQIQLDRRPQGWAFGVRGSSGIRIDESMKVWFSDDSCWQSALEGRGYALTRDVWAKNLDENGNLNKNPWWQQQIIKDRQMFVQRWGFEPW